MKIVTMEMLGRTTESPLGCGQTIVYDEFKTKCRSQPNVASTNRRIRPNGFRPNVIYRKIS